MAAPTRVDHRPVVRVAVVVLAMLGALLLARSAPAQSVARGSTGESSSSSATSWATSSAGALIARARAMDLASRQGWQRLLVYAGSTSSEVDGDDFFLSPSGRTDPSAELVATLTAMARPVAAGREDDHALCRFPARARFLDAELGFIATLPAPPKRCPAREAFGAGAEPTALSVVFAANDVASPPSAFGHILLRLHTRAPTHPTDDTDADDRGVDYTATTDTRNPVIYAVKGIGGMFAGRFRVSPYDTMLREYATHAARDVWEYRLALRPDELRIFVDHLWELSHAHIDYGYTGENCAYRLVALVDAAAPRLNLVDAVGPVVMPLDVVRAVNDEPGLVRSVAYRPSVRSAARIAVERLDADEQSLLDRLLEDPSAPLPPEVTGRRAVDVLDGAMRVLEARRTRGMMDGDDREALVLKARLSARRDAISVSDAGALGYVAPPPDPVGRAPDTSHGTVRLSLGSGLTSQFGSGFGEIGARLALHDFADPPAGAPDLVQVQLLDTRLRYDWGRRELTLDQLTFAELTTLAPLARFDERPSWRARAFGMRFHDDGCADCFAHGLNGSVGLATGTDDARFVIFVMADAFVGFASELDGIDGGFVRAGVGPYGGARVQLGASTVALLSGTWSWLPGQEGVTTFDLRGSLRSGLARDVALGIEAASQPRSVEARLATYVYF
jgi:hypothetical protein